MENITVGLVPAPLLPTKLIYKLTDSLIEDLQNAFPNEGYWKIDIEIDRLTGAANTVKEIMHEAQHLKAINKWDYAISLTDLPVFHNKGVVISDADLKDKVALISLPAFGLTPTAKKEKLTIFQMISELYYRTIHSQENIQFVEKGIGIKGTSKNKRFFGKLLKAFRFSTIKRVEYPKKNEGISIRFFIPIFIVSFCCPFFRSPRHV